MKIALIVNPLIPVPPEKYGGIERIVFLLIQHLLKKGHDVTLFASEHSKPGCPLNAYHESVNYNFKDFAKINYLTFKIAFGDFDLVHTFGRMSNIFMLMFCKLPKVVSYQLPPTISQVKKAESIAYSKSLYFTACSNYIADQIKPYCDVTTIYNGVDTVNYAYNDKVELDAPLVFLGRIQHEKGTAIAIDVAKKTGKRLVIAGNVPNEEVHQAYFRNEIIPFIDGDRVKYIGPVDDKEKNKLLGNAYALLMPVTWAEPFGIVMTEAMACGTPVIAFNLGAIPEVVNPGLNGYLCKNTDEMVEAVSAVRRISRRACRETVEVKFSAAVLGDHYEQLYDRIINRN